jgi:hypothetical protein
MKEVASLVVTEAISPLIGNTALMGSLLWLAGLFIALVLKH